MAKLVITDEMLDAIEAVKGRREANYWDPECRKYYEQQQRFNSYHWTKGGW